MPKRKSEHHPTHESKKRKLGDNASAVHENITSARHLEQLLRFQQDATHHMRAGIKSFKSFLESILYAPDKVSTVPQQKILHEFVATQIPPSSQHAGSPVLPDLVQAWSFSAQTDNEGLMSAVSAILALLLKTMSALIDFRDAGLHLCRYLLQESNLKLISRGLVASRQKEHLISPNLRLLTEIVTFDGGVLAKKVFKEKSFTFDGKFLARNLSLWKERSGDLEEDKRKPAVRSNAVRYLLAHLKLQPSAIKSEILKYGNVMRSLFDHLQHDPMDVLKEVLQVVKRFVLEDVSIPRSSKGYVLNERNLSNLINCHRQEVSSTKHSSTRQHLIVELLTYIIEDSRAGLLYPSSAWYPPGSEKGSDEYNREDDEAEIDLGLDSVEWYDSYSHKVPIRNVTLAQFAHKLRSFSSPVESKLVNDIFKSAPELVADYYFKKADFSFDPKLTATWIGEGYSTIPPPVTIIIENVLPTPLSQKTLTRCLNQQNELLTFFVLRILVAALEKLRTILSCFEEASKSEGNLWIEGSARLRDMFASRCPTMKEIISTYRKTPPGNVIYREVILRLISLLYQVVPEIATSEKFDISTVLAEELNYFQETLTSMGAPAADERTEHMRHLVLRHMLNIAGHSQDMRWTYRPQNLKHSPLLTLLNLLAVMPPSNTPGQIWDLASAVLQKDGLVQQQTKVQAIFAIVGSLTSTAGWSPSISTMHFIDDILARTVRKPIKYEDDLQIVLEKNKVLDPLNTNISLIHMTIVEQWPFAASQSEHDQEIAKWVKRYITASEAIGEHSHVLRDVTDALTRDAQNEHQRVALRLEQEDVKQTMENLISIHSTSNEVSNDSINTETIGPTRTTIDPVKFAPLPVDSKAGGLHRWSSKDVPDAISDGDVSSLILCLSSDYPEVRSQCISNLQAFMQRLDSLRSTYADHPQFYLLVGIFLNTASPLITNVTPGYLTSAAPETTESRHIPTFLTVYASLASRILQNPLHPLYDAINRFHTHSPKWDAERLASYWTHTILYTPCTASSGLSLSGRDHSRSSKRETQSENIPFSHAASTSASTFEESLESCTIDTPISFLLALIYHSLRSPTDLAILRKRGTLEPLLAMASGPSRSDTLDGTLCILWRITCIEGGGDILIRKGSIPWLGALLARSKAGVASGHGRKRSVASGISILDSETEQLSSQRGLKLLIQRIWDVCDSEWSDEWSGGVVRNMVEELTQGL